MDGELWGDASVTFPDWKGTAQVDERRTVPWEGLTRTVGLDADEWQVVGFSIRAASAVSTCGSSPRLATYGITTTAIMVARSK